MKVDKIGAVQIMNIYKNGVILFDHACGAGYNADITNVIDFTMLLDSELVPLRPAMVCRPMGGDGNAPASRLERNQSCFWYLDGRIPSFFVKCTT